MIDYKFKENDILKDVKKDNSSNKTILFSPAAASFDNFKNSFLNFVILGRFLFFKF